MKTVSLTTIGLMTCALAGAAFAADMPLKAPPPPVFSWTGCYVGGNAGGIGGRDWADLRPDGYYSLPVTGTGAPPTVSATGAATGDRLIVTNSYAANDSNWEAGVQAGCQKQYGVVVWGFEADWQWSGLSRSFDAAYPAFPSVDPRFIIPPHLEHVSLRLADFATARIRAGFTPWDPHFLVYGTAGFVGADLRSDTAVAFGTVPGVAIAGVANPTNVYNGALHAGSAKSFDFGATAGVGAEWAFWTNWSVKAEFLYFWVDGLKYTSPLLAAAQPFVPGYNWYTTTNWHEGVARVGVNYRFWSGW